MADAAGLAPGAPVRRLDRTAGWLAARPGWQRMGLAAVAGAANVLAMPPYGWWPVLFLTLPVLAWLVDGTGTPFSAGDGWRARFTGWRAAAATGWAYGFGFFLAGLYWIGNAFLVDAEAFAWMIPFVAVLMPGGLALFFALAVVAARAVAREGAARILALVVAWAIVEWLRGHILTGFPWNALGYAFAMSDALIQSAALWGLYGMTLLAALIGFAPAMLAGPGVVRSRALIASAVGCAVILPALLWGWGALRVPPGNVDMVPGVKLRIVQPNIPQADKWRPELRANHLALYLRLTRGGSMAGSADTDGITHVVWPESATPFLLDQTPDVRAVIADALPTGGYLLTGSVRAEPYEQRKPNGVWADFYNSAMVLDADGRIVSTYDKAHLVPFGEYLPMQGLLEAIGMEQLTRQRGGYSSGPGPSTIPVPGAPPVSVNICYEIIFPGSVAGSDRPGWIANLTNDAWFGDSIGPRQHLHQARMRAVEEGLPVIRAANTGISTVIDPYGRRLDWLDIGERGVIDSPLPGALEPTFYSIWRDTAFALLLALTIFTIVLVVNLSSVHVLVNRRY